MVSKEKDLMEWFSEILKMLNYTIMATIQLKVVEVGYQMVFY